MSIWLVNGPHKFTTEAECSEFSTRLTSDHFQPWLHDNGYGNFTSVWTAAAAERTKNEFLYQE
jgi:coenzyme F420-dependent glucose-6-phosphate dehydrogenase